MIKKIFLASFLFLGLFSYTPIVNYIELKGPVYLDDYRSPYVSSEEGIKVVTWNIRYANRIEQAIRELKNEIALQDADILLLQEVDEKSVDKIAKSLRMMYVF